MKQYLFHFILMTIFACFSGCKTPFNEDELNCKNGYVEYSDSISKYCGCLDSNNNWNGKWSWYDKNGFLYETHNYKNGMRVGEQIEYFKDQKMKTYVYNNFDEKAIFRRNYDSCGTVISTTGHYIAMVNTNLSEIKSLQPDDFIELDIYIALPKNCQAQLYGGFRSENKMKPLKVTNTRAKFIKRIHSYGKDQLVVKLIVKDADKGITVIEKYQLNVDVMRKEII